MGLEGLSNVMKALEERITSASNKQVVVGYSADYAVVVHEDLTRHHPYGQAQFLIQPAREMKDELKMIIRKALQAGEPIDQALLKAGERLLEASQEIVPYQTGFLHDSGFVDIEED